MKKEQCQYCYYEGIKKCFLFNKEFEEIEKCQEYLLDPYLVVPEPQVGEYCKTCHYYETEQCLGNEIAKENCYLEK